MEQQPHEGEAREAGFGPEQEARAIGPPQGDPAASTEPQVETPSPRIYVASLSDYNAGILHGAWLDASQDVDDLQAGVSQMLAESPTTKRYGDVAEEYAVHDYEGFGPVALSEYEPLEAVHQLASGIARYGEPFAAWWDMEDRSTEDWGDTLSQFEDHYVGEFSSITEYAEQLIEDMGFDLDRLDGVPESLRPYLHIDVEGWARDLELEGDIQAVESRDGVYVFWP